MPENKEKDSARIPDSKFSWKWDESSQSHVISVWEMIQPVRQSWQDLPTDCEIFPKKRRVTVNKVGKHVDELIKNIKNKKSLIRHILNRSLRWLPDSPSECFGIFLKTEYLSENELEVIKKSQLTRVSYGPFLILTRGERKWEFYKRALEFFFRFKHLVLAEDAGIQTPYLLYQIPTDSAANFTYLLFSFLDTGDKDTEDAINQGTGMLIKSLADPEYGGAIDREIEVILLGNFLKADVPQNAVIIKPGDEIIDQFGDKAPVFIEDLTPDCKPLNNATEYDIKKVASENPEILGRMLVFDTCAGAWDRHLGNYLVHNLDDGSRSIQEIDFGLFDPLWLKPGNYSGRLDDWVSSRYASFQGDDRPGWDITRHPRVTKMIEKSNLERVKAGVQQAMFQLELGRRTDWFESNLSEKFAQRIRAFLDPNSELKFGFEMDLATLGIQM
ncbi:MAG: hypothetical protein ACW981_01760 [Candidatus Hodarchaeales archaeon]|jgi:hypothetical protein